MVTLAVGGGLGCPVGRVLSATPSAVTGAARRDAKGLALEVVREPLESGWVDAGGMCERLGEQPVGEPGVAGKERAVKVGADRARDPAALAPGPTVVPEAVDDATESLGAVVEDGTAGVVLEPGELLP